MEKEIICVECPAGCRLRVEFCESGELSVFGNKCERGDIYARKEMTSPERLLTTTVKAEGLDARRVPVRTDIPVPKEKVKEIMKKLSEVKIYRPVTAGEIVVKNVLELGADIVATRSVE